MIVDVKANPIRARRATVLLHGEDVSWRCFFADDQAGYVDLYALNGEGKRYAVGHELATERRYGNVKITIGQEVE